jgi:hypothetical protein
MSTVDMMPSPNESAEERYRRYKAENRKRRFNRLFYPGVLFPIIGLIIYFTFLLFFSSFKNDVQQNSPFNLSLGNMTNFEIQQSYAMVPLTQEDSNPIVSIILDVKYQHGTEKWLGYYPQVRNDLTKEKFLNSQIKQHSIYSIPSITIHDIDFILIESEQQQ